MKEIKKHPYLNCSVSNEGEVFGPRNIPLKGSKQRYHRVTVTTKDNITKTCSVHRLVVEAFKGLIPPNMTINHIDGNKLNNNISNLEIITQEENTQHARDNNLFKKMIGENNGNSLLKENQVLEIYELIKKGYNNQEIAKNFNLNFRTISQIRTGRRWNHLYKKYMKETIKSNNLRNKNIERNLKLLYEIIKGNKSNTVLAKEYELEPSMISRIKSKKTWLQMWNLYYRNATTISKESTS